MPFWGKISFTNLTRVCSSFLERLHDTIMVWLIIIFIAVIIVRVRVTTGTRATRMTPDSMVLESTWTVVPMLILVRIAFPSIHLLCLQDSLCLVPTSTAKVTRNQWNWQRTLLEDYWDHLLDADKLENVGSYEIPLILPNNSYPRILLSRTDVLHSLGFPRLGVKLDSIPGRINSTVVETSVNGVFRGSCYELCGRGHRVIPIYALIN